MKGINSIVFKDAVGGKEENIAAIRPTLEEYGFAVKGARDNVFELRNLTKSVLVAVEDQKVILHTGFGRRIREDALATASCKILELNAEHRLLMGVDMIDNEVCCAYTFMLPARTLTKEAFENVFARYMQMADICEDLISKQLRPYFVGILDENEDTESVLRRILHRRPHLPVFDADDIPFDMDDDDDDDDDDDEDEFIKHLLESIDDDPDDDE